MSATVKVPINLTFHPKIMSTRGWIAQAFSLYRAKHGDKMDTSPKIPLSIDLRDTITDSASGEPKARFRVVATTAPPECQTTEGFVGALTKQKLSGNTRKQPLDQLWAIRDNVTLDVWICSPDVFVNLSDQKSAPAKNRQINVFQVFGTEEAIKQIAGARRNYLVSLNKQGGGKDPKLKHIMQEMVSLAKRADKEAPTTPWKPTASSEPVELRDYSIQVGPNTFMPVCSTAYLHKVQADVETPFDEELLNPPSNKRRARTSDKAASSRPVADDDEDDEEEPRVTKRPRKKSSSDDEKVFSRAKRGCELSCDGATIDPEDDGEETEPESDERRGDADDDCFGAFEQCLKDLARLIPNDVATEPPSELHRAISAELEAAAAGISEDACKAVCEQLDLDEYDNDDIVTHAPNNSMCTLRAKTGVDKKLKLPAWYWPLALHFKQFSDPDVRAYITSAPQKLAAASKPWAVQTTRPMSRDQIPATAEWSGLLNAKTCEQVTMLGFFERFTFATLRKHISAIEQNAQAVSAKCRDLLETTETQAARIEDLKRDLMESDAREQELQAKVLELEAKVATNKLPPLPAPTKKKPAAAVDDNEF